MKSVPKLTAPSKKPPARAVFSFLVARIPPAHGLDQGYSLSVALNNALLREISGEIALPVLEISHSGVRKQKAPSGA